MEHLKKFERFVQQKADTIRRELADSGGNKSAKIIRQIEVLSLFVGALDVSSSSILSPQSTTSSSSSTVPSSEDANNHLHTLLPASLSKQHVPASVFKGSSKWASENSGGSMPIKTGVFASMDDEIYCMLTSLHIDDTVGLSLQQLAHVLRLLCGPRETWGGVLRRVVLERCSLAPLMQSCCQLFSSPTAAALTHITLRGASLADDSLSYFVDALLLSSTGAVDGNTVPHLVELDLSWNQITLAAPLAKLLVLHPSLRLLDVSYNLLGAMERNATQNAVPLSETKTAGGFLSDLANKLESTFKSNSQPSTSAVVTRVRDQDEETPTTTSRFFVEEPDDDDEENSVSSKPMEEEMFVLVRELLRPRDDLWKPDTMWAGSIRTIVATYNGITSGCIVALQKLFDRDCAAIHDRGEQERHLRATSSNDSSSVSHANLITEENAQFFVPALHLSRLIFADEQLAVLSESHGSEASRFTQQMNNYSPNGLAAAPATTGEGKTAPHVACGRLGKVVATRRQNIRQWLRNNDDEEEEEATEPQQLQHQNRGEHTTTTTTKTTTTTTKTVPSHSDMGPRSDGSLSSNQDTTTAAASAAAVASSQSTTDQFSLQRDDIGSVSAMLALMVEGHQILVDALEMAMGTQLEWSLERTALLSQYERDRSRIQQREATDDMLRRHACNVRAVALEMEQQVSLARSDALVEAERYNVANEKRATLQRQLDQLTSEKRRLWHNATEQIQRWGQVMVTSVEESQRQPPPPPPLVQPLMTSVGCSTDLRMVELEEWRQQKMKRRDEHRAARIQQQKPEIAANRQPLNDQSSKIAPPTQLVGSAPVVSVDEDEEEDAESDDIVPDSTHNFEIVLRTDESFAMMTKDQWQHDAAATSCNQCGRAFDLLHRRHHCRRCGGVHCSKCAPKSALHGDVRICKGCTSGGSRRSSVVGKR